MAIGLFGRVWPGGLRQISVAVLPSPVVPNGGIMFGLIAEDVEKVDPDLVTRNDKGEARDRAL